MVLGRVTGLLLLRRISQGDQRPRFHASHACSWTPPPSRPDRIPRVISSLFPPYVLLYRAEQNCEAQRLAAPRQRLPCSHNPRERNYLYFSAAFCLSRNPCFCFCFFWPREKVEQVNVTERSIKLSGVDLVDGTPVLDIKPYVPDYDCPRPRDSPDSESAGRGDGVRVAVSGCRDRGSTKKCFGGKAGGYATAAHVLSFISRRFSLHRGVGDGVYDRGEQLLQRSME